MYLLRRLEALCLHALCALITPSSAGRLLEAATAVATESPELAAQCREHILQHAGALALV